MKTQSLTQQYQWYRRTWLVSVSDFADIFCLGEYLREIDTLFENTLAYE